MMFERMLSQKVVSHRMFQQNTLLFEVRGEKKSICYDCESETWRQSLWDTQVTSISIYILVMNIQVNINLL
jgi:hypothetical protein